MKKKQESKIEIYQGKNGAIEFSFDAQRETVWASLQQIADLFDVDKSGISRHIKNIFKTKELNENSVVAKIATTASDGKIYQVDYYNLDVVLSVGYRVNSKRATQFRVWANNILKQYLLQGYVINKKVISKNHGNLVKALETIKKLAKDNDLVGSQEVLDLAKAFANTWVSLDAYDKSALPQKGAEKKNVVFMAEELQTAIEELKKSLIEKKQATDLFAQEKNKNSFVGTVGNVFQSFGGKDLYPTVEEKAAHLLYFVVKNHCFTDGNKRSGAFSFVWFLQKAKMLDKENMSPSALTALTLLIAESNPKDKDKMVGLVLLLLRK